MVVRYGPGLWGSSRKHRLQSLVRRRGLRRNHNHKNTRRRRRSGVLYIVKSFAFLHHFQFFAHFQRFLLNYLLNFRAIAVMTHLLANLTLLPKTYTCLTFPTWRFARHETRAPGDVSRRRQVVDLVVVWVVLWHVSHSTCSYFDVKSAPREIERFKFITRSAEAVIVVIVSSVTLRQLGRGVNVCDSYGPLWIVRLHETHTRLCTLERHCHDKGFHLKLNVFRVGLSVTMCQNPWTELKNIKD